jgi:hypothetical protein
LCEEVRKTRALAHQYIVGGRESLSVQVRGAALLMFLLESLPCL